MYVVYGRLNLTSNRVRAERHPLLTERLIMEILKIELKKKKAVILAEYESSWKYL